MIASRKEPRPPNVTWQRDLRTPVRHDVTDALYQRRPIPSQKTHPTSRFVAHGRSREQPNPRKGSKEYARDNFGLRQRNDPPEIQSHRSAQAIVADRLISRLPPPQHEASQSMLRRSIAGTGIMTVCRPPAGAYAPTIAFMRRNRWLSTRMTLSAKLGVC